MASPVIFTESQTHTSRGRANIITYRKVESIFNAMLNLIDGYDKMPHQGARNVQLAGKKNMLVDDAHTNGVVSNMVYIAKRVLADTAIDVTKFSPVVNAPLKLVLVYDGKVVLKGNEGTTDMALTGLMSASVKMISDWLDV